MKLAYPAVVAADEDGRFVVTFPDFGWGATDGATYHEALIEAEDCLAEIIATTIKDDEDLPEPSDPEDDQVLVSSPIDISAKVILNIAVKQRHIKTVDLARSINVNEKETRRILDPFHKTKMNRLEKALHAVGKRIVISFEDDDCEACA